MAALAAATPGGLVFTGVYLAEGATRAGYRTLAQPISLLSLGPGGRGQQLNFIVSACWCLSAAGWRAALAPGRGALALPVLHVIAGVGLVTDGLLPRILPAGTRRVLARGSRRYMGRCTPCSR